MMMNDSAAEFVIASSVAFSVSAPNYTGHALDGTCGQSTYNTTFLDDVDGWIHVVLRRLRYTEKAVQDA